MKKHGEADRINCGMAAILGCYSKRTVSVDKETFSLPPPGNVAIPQVPGVADVSLQASFGVVVTRREPMEVKGKGTLHMFWVDVPGPTPSATAAVERAGALWLAVSKVGGGDASRAVSGAPESRTSEVAKPTPGTPVLGGAPVRRKSGVAIPAPATPMLGALKECSGSFRVRAAETKELLLPAVSILSDGVPVPHLSDVVVSALDSRTPAGKRRSAARPKSFTDSRASLGASRSARERRLDDGTPLVNRLRRWSRSMLYLFEINAVSADVAVSRPADSSATQDVESELSLMQDGDVDRVSLWIF